MRRSRGAARARRASRSRASSPRARRPSPGEAGLLELAQALGATTTASAQNDALASVLALLHSAFGHGAALPRQLAQAWLRTRGDKTAALALGWAREQVRRALAEALLRQDRRADVRADVPVEAAAWLLLAAAEAEAHEPGGTVGDRLSMVCDLLRVPQPG